LSKAVSVLVIGVKGRPCYDLFDQLISPDAPSYQKMTTTLLRALRSGDLVELSTEAPARKEVVTSAKVPVISAKVPVEQTPLLVISKDSRAAPSSEDVVAKSDIVDTKDVTNGA
jgi:hypothetical protein